MSSKTILLATDLGCRSDRALDRAADLALRWGAALHVVHALKEHELAQDLPSWRRPPDPRAVASEQVRRDLQGAPGLSLEVFVERGEPADVILDLAGKRRYDLIVTGVASDEAFGGFSLGNTATRLIRDTEVPVLVVKTRTHGPYRKLVVATDFSEGSRQALETGLELLPGAAVGLFHAFDLAYDSLLDDKGAAREEAETRTLAESRRFLAATPAVADSGRPVSVACEYGPAGPLLREYVQVHKADLVVVGTEGRRGIAKVFLGSTAEDILEAVAADVLVVRRRRT